MTPVTPLGVKLNDFFVFRFLGTSLGEPPFVTVSVADVTTLCLVVQLAEL